jgi:hypothetical protein
MVIESPTSFRIGQASALSGLGLPMIDYLCRTQIMVPAAGKGRSRGRGRERRFTFADVVVLRLIAKLLQRGIGVRRLRRDLRLAAQWYRASMADPAPLPYLCTDGARAFFRRKNAVLEEVGSGQFAFGFIIDVERVKAEVIELIATNPLPKKWARRPRRSEPTEGIRTA